MRPPQFREQPPTFLNYLVHLDKLGTRKAQLKHVNWILTRISKHANLDKPEEIDKYISYLQGSDSYKANLTQVYGQYCDYQKIPYKRPKYNKTAKPIRIPTHEKIKMIIAESGKTLATKLTLSLETGIRPVELCDLKVKDIDLEQHLVYPTTAKNGAPRTLKISNNLSALIQTHIIRKNLNPDNKLFKTEPKHYANEYRRVRNRLAKKLNDPTLHTIRLYDFRHYFATMLYHKTRDILFVKTQMGHKRIENTMIYTQLLNLNEDEWHCKTAQNVQEATNLIESGFEYVNTIGEIALYRKRK